MSNTNPNTGHTSSSSNILSNFIHSINHPTSSLASSAMSDRSSTSTLTPSSSDGAPLFNYSACRQMPLLQGALHKLHKNKSKRKKYFVIFDDAPNRPQTARLEYFEDEKKCRSAMQKSPDNGIFSEKRSIILSKCFNINKRIDVPKYKYVIGLYRKDDVFSIIMNDEIEMNEWLRQLLILQRGEPSMHGEPPKPNFGEFLSKFLFYAEYSSFWERHELAKWKCTCIVNSILQLSDRF